MNSSQKELEENIHKLIDSISEKEMSSEKWIAFSKELHEQLENLQLMYLKNVRTTIDCKAGCSFCCNHWVEDVYFFESLSIVKYLKENLAPEKLEAIRQIAKLSENVFMEIYDSHEDLDEVTLLNWFYEKQIPCPLLDDSGKCTVYEIRPLTCRSFFSESASKHCDPESRNSEGEGTFMITPGDEIESKLDDLHLAYGEKYPLSLRAMLAFMV